MTSIRIVQCDDSLAAAWNAFVDRSPDTSFYHRFEWQRINQQAFGHETAYLAALDANGTVRGVFPLVRLKSRLFGNIACSMPFVNYGGPCADDAAILERLLNEARTVINGWNVDYLEIRSRQDLGSGLATSQHKVSMTIALDRDPDVLWNAFKGNHRTEIRKAGKNGFEVKFGGAELLDDFYTVLSESWRDLGTPIYRKSYLESIVSTFTDRVRLCVVYANGEPAAAAFDGSHAGVLEGMWMGTRSQYRNRLVGYVLYWELIKNACEGGYSRFHLGRSTVQSGGETFKKKWNAIATPLYWHYVLRTTTSMPELNVNNPKYQLAINVWRRMPVALTQIVGPMVARSIP